ncbi:hypothetical protein HaLaN_03759 [Haematococcus lacustris]|uniref:Uncharacterized protein n=1 Tax=Haematococcus lacustris TaxID=44745 RepID=A0A699Z084_HAELA|nr:hypothetical protein HaLaN_03759 [Haematococcus lacustris]
MECPANTQRDACRAPRRGDESIYSCSSLAKYINWVGAHQVSAELQPSYYQSGAPKMGLVIFMQILTLYCTVFDSVCHIDTGELLRVYRQAAR